MSDTVQNMPLRTSLVEKVQGWVIVAVFRLLALFPLFMLRKLGEILGTVLWYTHTQSRRITEINLTLCFPDKSAQERKRLARQSLVETSIAAFEVAALWLWSPAQLGTLIKKISGEQYLQAALQEARGVILLIPHLGNWEVVGVYAAQRSQFTALYAPAKIKALNEIMVNGRTRMGYQLAPTNPQGVKKLLKALKAGQVVGILPDQVPEPESGVFAPLFAQPAFTMTLIANLAARTGAQVICCYAKRLQAESGFEICLRPAAENIASTNLEEAVIALNQSVEACVMDCPEQYQWEYKRFKKRPPGQSPVY